MCVVSIFLWLLAGEGGRGLIATGPCFTRTPQSQCNPRDNANPTEPTLARFNQKGMYLRVLGGSWNLQNTREPVSERTAGRNTQSTVPGCSSGGRCGCHILAQVSSAPIPCDLTNEGQ